MNWLLPSSFAEIEGTGRSTQIFDETTRILAEEGVYQALAYAATKRPRILEKVKARAIATGEKNRADLLPLLKSAQLQADRNQPDAATSLFARFSPWSRIGRMPLTRSLVPYHPGRSRILSHHTWKPAATSLANLKPIMQD